MRILVVGSNKPVREAYVKLVEGVFPEADVEEDTGERAVEQLAGQRALEQANGSDDRTYGAIFVGQRVKGGAGLGLVRALREKGYGGKIFMFADQSCANVIRDSLIQAAEAAGANDFYSAINVSEANALTGALKNL